MQLHGLAVLLCLVVTAAAAGEIPFRSPPATDASAVSAAMTELAQGALQQDKEGKIHARAIDRFHVQLTLRNYDAALAALRDDSGAEAEPRIDRTFALHIYALAKSIQSKEGISFEESFRRAFHTRFASLDDRSALDAAWLMGTRSQFLRQSFENSLETNKQASNIDVKVALELLEQYVIAVAYREFEPFVDSTVADDDLRRYVIEPDVLIKARDGATLSAIVVRSRKVSKPQPTALLFTIYTNVRMNTREAKSAAAHGYVGVVADARGKRLSPDAIQPWEHEANDTYAVIDWISKQSWSDGQVGMYGGSYSAFAQWAAMKRMHPALKTIVPSAATHPGFGLPMQNNVFQNSNYAWYFYVANDKYLDDNTYFDQERWSRLNANWYASGRPYREIDQVDGEPHKLLQRQLQHPEFDRYWQAMTAYGREYAKIGVPVLSITGYFDDAQVSAIRYLTDHYRYNKDAEHYLVIGPYDHFGAQIAYKPPNVRNYAIDPVAQMDTVALTYQWFDYVMKQGPKPALLKDRINFQVMGANVWQHARNLEEMSNGSMTLHLTDERNGEHFRLGPKPNRNGSLEQIVDFSDRSTTNSLYPVHAIQSSMDTSNCLSFISEPLQRAASINGRITAELRAIINKKDFDPTMTVYEVTSTGEFFNLSYYLGRASYARDMTTRKLLTPGRVTSIPVTQTPVVSRQLKAGSRLLVLLTVNKNGYAQVNYGTGKDVSDESIADAAEPLRVKWLSDSYVRIPITE
jgi:uncharacterized protein